MKLINADTIPYFGETEVGDHITFKSAIDKLEEVDAEPVRHGRWIKKINPQWKAYSHDCCSECGWWNTRNALCYDGKRKPGHSLNYCPNCGAKMDVIFEVIE